MYARDHLNPPTFTTKDKGENLGIPLAYSHQAGPTHHKFHIFPHLNLSIHNDNPNQKWAIRIITNSGS
jgi:hypothetical protein